jgi:TRAP-type C4-dicarboxylate transport system permease small subunit
VSHGHGLEPAVSPVRPGHVLSGTRPGWFERCNALLLKLSMCAMVLTALVLTYAVVSRYFFKAPTDWQDEASVFMLVGVTFSCSAWVQSSRGHIGIEALASVLPPVVNAVRQFVVDLLSFLFCGFFAWKSWTLFHEAWVDGQTTSSTFAPPLWIPYSMMAAGMTLLTLQILAQLGARASGKRNTQ